MRKGFTIPTKKKKMLTGSGRGKEKERKMKKSEEGSGWWIEILLRCTVAANSHGAASRNSRLVAGEVKLGPVEACRSIHNSVPSFLFDRNPFSPRGFGARRIHINPPRVNASPGFYDPWL